MPTEYTWSADSESWCWRLDLLEQLLACYQQALGHKLRNQLITIRGLANLLQLELGDHLDDEPRSYLDRLVHVAADTGDLMRTFADLGRLCRDLELASAVELTEAVREAVIEVKMLYPRRPIGYDLQEKMPIVLVPRRPLHLALVQLLRLAVELAGEGCATSIGVTAERLPHGLALNIVEAARDLSEDELAQLFKRLVSGAVAADQGLDLFLVRQATALWGGGLRMQSSPGRGTTFTLLFAQTMSG